MSTSSPTIVPAASPTTTPPTTSSPAPAPTSDMPSWAQSLTQTLTPLRAIGAFAAGSCGIAVLRFFGEQYTSAVYQTLHIPPAQLTLSVWDHGVPGLYVTWTAVIVVLFVVGLVSWYLSNIGASIEIIVSWPWWGRLSFGLILSSIALAGTIWQYSWAGTRSMPLLLATLSIVAAMLALPLHRYITWRPRGNGVRGALLILLVLGLPFVIDWFSALAERVGTTVGQAYVRQVRMQVQFIADTPGLIDQPAAPIQYGATQQSYRYQGLYFLTFNDGRYFVFDQLTGDCAPAHVYIIREEDVRSAQYVVAAAPTCGVAP